RRLGKTGDLDGYAGASQGGTGVVQRRAATDRQQPAVRIEDVQLPFPVGAQLADVARDAPAPGLAGEHRWRLGGGRGGPRERTRRRLAAGPRVAVGELDRRHHALLAGVHPLCAPVPAPFRAVGPVRPGPWAATRRTGGRPGRNGPVPSAPTGPSPLAP